VGMRAVYSGLGARKFRNKEQESRSKQKGLFRLASGFCPGAPESLAPL
jgi:hypothetical protein